MRTSSHSAPIRFGFDSSPFMKERISRSPNLSDQVRAALVVCSMYDISGFPAGTIVSYSFNYKHDNEPHVLKYAAPKLWRRLAERGRQGGGLLLSRRT